MTRAIFLFVLIILAPSMTFGQENRQGELADRLPPLLRDVDLSTDQRQQAKRIVKSFQDKLMELRKSQNLVYSSEQRDVRRQAIEQARQSGKSAQETRQAAEAATQLTAEQTRALADLEEQRRELQQILQAELVALLTSKQKQEVQRGSNRPANAGTRPINRRSRIEPTHANVAYGPHARNVMDAWLAKSDEPTPVLFAIHGGGFRGGNKSVDAGLLQACLDNGISVVAITYRLSGEAIAPAQFHDSARAIQFVRSQATAWNIDKTRFASSGGSAGAGISLWLAFHDDLADNENSDPVLRESTRLKCAIVYNGQSTYDPREIKRLIPEANTYRHSALDQLYGIDGSQGFENLPAEKIKLIEECSPINHVTEDDVPVLLAYATDLDTPVTNQGIGIHHPRFGTHLQQKMKPLGLECVVKTKSRRGSEDWVQQTMDFLKKHL